MTALQITIWECDAASCDRSAPAGADGWFSSLYADGCPAHAEIVAAHEYDLTYSTRGRGSRATTTITLTCRCGWIPPSRWMHGSVDALVFEYLDHVREITAPDRPTDTTEETPNHG